MKTIIQQKWGLGNTLHTIPLARALKRLYGEVDLACKEKWHGIFEDQDIFTTLYDTNYKNENEHDIQILTKIKKQDLFINKKKHRIANGFKLCHETDWHMNFAKYLGWKKNKPSHLLSRPWKLDPITKLLPNDFISIITRSAELVRFERKNWKEGNWEKLAKLLSFPIVFLGPKTSRRSWMNKYGINLCGKTTIKQARDILFQTFAAIGPDCGLIHLAACCDIPTISLFGPTNIIKNQPSGEKSIVLTAGLKCSPCQFTKKWKRCTEWKCMNSITPKMVLERFESIL